MVCNNTKELMNNRDLHRHLKTLPGFIHNLNSPIMNISGRVELIQFKYPEISASEQILKQIDKVNDIIESLRKILEMGNRSSTKVIDLPPFLETFTKYLNFYLDFKHNIIVNLQSETSAPIKIAPRYLLIIFNEIFLNALNYIDGKAAIDVRISSKNSIAKAVITRSGRPFTQKELDVINQDKDADPHKNEEDLQGLILAKILIQESKGTIIIDNTGNDKNYTLTFGE